MRLVTIAAVATLAGAGCSSHVTAARIAELDLPSLALQDPVFAEQRVLLRRFTDARPAEFSRRLAGAGLVIGGQRDEYTLAYAQAGRRGNTTVYLGALTSELPYLLMRSLPGDNVRVADDLPDAGAYGEWDYVVEGRLTRTADTQRGSLALVYLGILGVPTGWRRYEIEYELSVYAGDAPDLPIVVRTYTVDDRATTGLYRSSKPARDLPLRALRTIVAQSARDLVAEVDKHHARLAAGAISPTRRRRDAERYSPPSDSG